MRASSSATLQGKANDASRLLIVRVGAMGDVIHALPIVTRLREAMPQAHIGWAIEPRWSPLLRSGEPPGRHAERMPLVDEVHPVEAKRWNRDPVSRATVGSMMQLRASLREARYDLAIDLQGTLRSAAIARIGGASPTVGSAAPREGLARMFYSCQVAETATHVTDRGWELVRAALPELASASTRPLPTTAPLPQDPVATNWWQERKAELVSGRKAVLLAATAGWGAKEWPRASFAALAAQLARWGYAVLLNTAPDAVDVATDEVLRRVGEIDRSLLDVVRPLPATLPQLIAATRDVEAAIAGDTGPLHLAAVLGRPTVGLFGPTAPERTGPRGPHSINPRNASSVTDHQRRAATEAGLSRITVDEVLNALEVVLGAPRCDDEVLCREAPGEQV